MTINFFGGGGGGRRDGLLKLTRDISDKIKENLYAVGYSVASLQ